MGGRLREHPRCPGQPETFSSTHALHPQALRSRFASLFEPLGNVSDHQQGINGQHQRGAGGRPGADRLEPTSRLAPAGSSRYRARWAVHAGPLPVTPLITTSFSSEVGRLLQLVLRQPVLVRPPRAAQVTDEAALEAEGRMACVCVCVCEQQISMQLISFGCLTSCIQMQNK